MRSVLFCAFETIENCLLGELVDFPVILSVFFIRKFSRKFPPNSIFTIFCDYKTHSAGKRVRSSQASWINWVIHLIATSESRCVVSIC